MDGIISLSYDVNYLGNVRKDRACYWKRFGISH